MFIMDTNDRFCVRVNALYSQHKAVLVLLATVLTVEVGVQAYLLSTGIR